MRSGKRKIYPVWILVSLGLLAGCSAQDTRNLGQDARNMASHTGQAVGNAELVTSIHAALALRKGVDMSGLHIEAQDGLVTLSGHVRNKEERQRVVTTVQGIRGVNKVVDHLSIQP